MIVLLFGQPASGKTTLANMLHHTYQKDSYWLRNTVRIDGDKWREVTQNKDYSREGRIRNLKGAFDMALYLELEGFTPILSLVTPYEELRQYLREKALESAHIYLYYEGGRGRDDRFAPDFEEPTDNCLIINTSKLGREDSLHNIYEYIKNLIRWRAKGGD